MGKTIIGALSLAVCVHAELTVAKRIPMLVDTLKMVDTIPVIGTIIGWMEALPRIVVDIVAILTAKFSAYLYAGLDTILLLLYAGLTATDAVMAGRYLLLILPIVTLAMIAIRMEFIAITSIPGGAMLMQYDTIIVLGLTALQFVF